MSSSDDNREKNSYYYETENETDDDGDTRSIISSENYIEDFDNKSERDTMKEVSDDMLFDITDETDRTSNIIENEVESEIPVNFSDPEPPQEELYDSSLLIQYNQNEDGKISIPYGIYNECRKTSDGNSVCKQTELTNDTGIMDECIINDINNEDAKECDVTEDVANDENVMDENVMDENVTRMSVSDNVINDIVGNEKNVLVGLEDIPKENEVTRRRGRKTEKKKKRNSYKKFNYTKKGRSEVHHNSFKKKGSRNKRKISKKKVSRRR